jgi:hypothetical protein
MYTHITNSRIINITNSYSPSQRKTASETGKPAGLWYAYGDEWKEHFYNKKKNDKKPLWKYILNLKDADFTDDYETPAPTKILKLNRANIEDIFMKYGKEFVKSNADILNDLIFSRQTDGDGTLNFLVGSKPIKCDNNNNNNSNNNSIKNLPEDLKELANDIYSLICEYINIEDIPSESLDLLIKEIDERYDDIPYETFNWYEFWSKLAENFAGVEFAEDLLDVKEIPNPDPEKRGAMISTPFLSKVEIRSGVIFKPATFFAGRKEDWIEEAPKNGGRRLRKTLKNKRRQLKTKKRRVHKK